MTPSLTPDYKPFFKTPQGIPFVSDPGLMTQEELETKVKYGGHMRVRVFDLSQPDDLAEYTRVWQKIAEGPYFKVRELLQENRETHNWTALLQWLELYAVPPKR
jgi:hypothetical protein